MGKVIDHLVKNKKWYISGSLIVISLMWLFIPIVSKNIDYLMRKQDILGFFSYYNKNSNTSFISSILVLNKIGSNSLLNSTYFKSYEITTICLYSFGALITCSIIPFILKDKYKSLYLLLFFIPIFIFLFYIPYSSIYNSLIPEDKTILLSPNVGFYIIIFSSLFIITLLLLSLFKNKSSKSKRISHLENQIDELRYELNNLKGKD